ncbi:MAG: zinc ribbon domain-containing protein [Armatimonadetes bacterium]|nr:zinc ribbon domain-containing protein [Armatimonadota bacterium]
MAEEHASEVTGLRRMVDESIEALRTCFRADRLLTAGLGIGVAFVLAGVAGTAAAAYLLRNALAPAAMLGILAGFLVYAGLLVTYGALARMAVAQRHGMVVSLAQAFAFAGQRSHILIGMPLFVLVVAIGVGSLGGYVGAALAANRTLGSGLAPVALVLLFVLNLVLVTAVLISHCLTAPCVACLDPSFAALGSRLVEVGRERLGSFYAHQAVAVLGGLPLVLLTTGVFLMAFQPAFTATAAGRATALVQRQVEATPAPPTALPGPGQPTPAEQTRDWVTVLRGWAGWASNVGGPPLMSAAVVLALLLGMFPLTYGASVQSAIYLGLTGDHFLAAPEPTGAEGEAPPGKRPPIVHCWRCDAINRYEAARCSKCGATLVTCPYCFATNQPEQAECSSCGRRLVAERSGAEEV